MPTALGQGLASFNKYPPHQVALWPLLTLLRNLCLPAPPEWNKIQSLAKEGRNPDVYSPSLENLQRVRGRHATMRTVRSTNTLSIERSLPTSEQRPFTYKAPTTASPCPVMTCHLELENYSDLDFSSVSVCDTHCFGRSPPNLTKLDKHK